MRPSTPAHKSIDGQRQPSRVRHAGRITTLAVAAAAVLTTVAGPGAAATPVPPTPSPFPASVESLQPYVGQAVCDPVAKPGVRAFQRLLLNTYRTTSSLGIVRDCGIGGRSEHKEGRAFDWGVSANNPRHVAEVNAVLTWLLATDRNGHRYARARRLGIMYIIWNRKIWKAYDPGKGWAPYTGASPHTDHVHFSFGWNGARKRTSWFDGTVAAVDYGPGGAPTAPAPPPAVPVVTPVPSTANLAVLAQYGDLTLSRGSNGAAVRKVQETLKVPADGWYGEKTAGAVTAFQRRQRVPATGVFGPGDWRRLFPPPVAPFGALDAVQPVVGDPVIAGWALDADTTDPIGVHLYVNGRYHSAVRADRSRRDVAAAYTAYGPGHGFSVELPLPQGRHTVCAYAINAAGTPGNNPRLGCATVVEQHTAVGALQSAVQTPAGVEVEGWALDPDTVRSNGVHLYVDGRYTRSLVADRREGVVAGYPLHGDRHGFRTVVQMGEGTRTLCVYSMNTPGTPGAGNPRIGCRTVVVRHRPTGSLERVAATADGASVSGWALDHDSRRPVSVHVYADGRWAGRLTADRTREDVERVHPGYGARRGFSGTVTLSPGRRNVCVYAINRAGTPGGTTRLGCATVVVPERAAGARGPALAPALGASVPELQPGELPDPADLPGEAGAPLAPEQPRAAEPSSGATPTPTVQRSPAAEPAEGAGAAPR